MKNDLGLIPDALRRDVLRAYLDLSSFDTLVHTIVFRATYHSGFEGDLADNDRVRLLRLAVPLLRVQVAQAERRVATWRQPSSMAEAAKCLADAERDVLALQKRAAEAEAALVALGGSVADDIDAVVDAAAKKGGKS